MFESTEPDVIDINFILLKFKIFLINIIEIIFITFKYESVFTMKECLNGASATYSS